MGIGCWSFGGGDYWGPQAEGAEDEVVSAALDRGITYFDTAPMYNDGRSEEALGRALSGRRGEAIIGTKVMPEDCLSARTLRRACEDSLRRLRTDTIDIYFVHWPIPQAHVEDAFAALIALRDEGKVRQIGLSNHGCKQIAGALSCGVAVSYCELCYNLLCRAIERELLPLCSQRGIGVVAYMPLMQGLLAGRYRAPDEVPASIARTRHFSGSRPEARHGEPGVERETFKVVRGVEALAADVGLPVHLLSLAWAKARAEIATVLVGVRNRKQLEANVPALEIDLAPEVIARCDGLTRPLLECLGSSPDYYESSSKSRIF